MIQGCEALRVASRHGPFLCSAAMVDMIPSGIYRYLHSDSVMQLSRASMAEHAGGLRSPHRWRVQCCILRVFCKQMEMCIRVYSACAIGCTFLQTVAPK